MATTPPMHSAVHTPPTPLHGARYDSYQPYSTRKSTRYSTQRSQRAAQTPPPQSSDPKLHSPPASTKVTTTGHQTAHTYSPPSSPHHSPRKTSSGSGKTKKSEDSSGMKETSLSFESTSIDLFQEPNISSTLDLQSSNRGANMLPTPAKTPRKKPISAPAIASTARVLFPVQTETVGDAIPTPRKKGRKRRNAGFSLNSSMEDDDNEDKIRIFTDSKEKIPELDPSEDNPFYDNPNHDGPPKEAPRTVSDSIAKKRKLRSTVSGNKEIEEAFKREEGMVYVFRGKKIYRKFADDLEPEDPVWDDADTETSPRLRPLTRSSIKPRLLFPTSTQHNERSLANKEDEEAITDIEDLPPLPNDSEMTDLAPETEDEPLVTPVKASFASPATPPATGHATRSATKRANLHSSSPPVPETADTTKFSEHKQIKKLSPFDGWQRTKATAPGYASGKGRKRVGEPLDLDGGGSKRMKGNEV